MGHRGNTHLRSGKHAERIAREHLQANGLRLLKANYRCRAGELDLVMLDGELLVIVEVRYRKSSSIVGPMHTVDFHKRRRLGLATRHFLMCHDELRDHPIRFDVIGLTGNTNKPCVNWVKNAFEFDVVW